MVERGGLENRCTRKGTVGSNPTLSAIITAPTRGFYNGRNGWMTESPQGSMKPAQAGERRRAFSEAVRGDFIPPRMKNAKHLSVFHNSVFHNPTPSAINFFFYVNNLIEIRRLALSLRIIAGFCGMGRCYRQSLVTFCERCLG